MGGEGCFAALAVALVVAGCFVSSGCGSGGEVVEVSEATWTDGPWPLTVASGQLSCEGTSARPVPWFESPDGRMWPLNGIAMGEAASRGGVFQTEITPIHAPNAELMAEMRGSGRTGWRAGCAHLGRCLDATGVCALRVGLADLAPPARAPRRRAAALLVTEYNRWRWP